jgi:hypothetical protein
MLPPFACCSGSGDPVAVRRRHQQRKLSMLQFWRDGLERQLAALDGAISTLQAQIERDRPAGGDAVPPA